MIRLLKVFVSSCNTEGDEDLKFRRMGKLTDKYLREISPDQNLEVSKFLEVAESLPGSARDWFDGLFRAIDIYLEVRFLSSMIFFFFVFFIQIIECSYGKLEKKICTKMKKKN